MGARSTQQQMSNDLRNNLTGGLVEHYRTLTNESTMLTNANPRTQAGQRAPRRLRSTQRSLIAPNNCAVCGRVSVGCDCLLSSWSCGRCARPASVRIVVPAVVLIYLWLRGPTTSAVCTTQIWRCVKRLNGGALARLATHPSLSVCSATHARTLTNALDDSSRTADKRSPRRHRRRRRRRLPNPQI